MSEEDKQKLKEYKKQYRHNMNEEEKQKKNNKEYIRKCLIEYRNNSI